MNKIFRHKILAGAMLFGFMLSGTSCQDIEGVGGTVTDDRTLFDLIKSDPELTEFVRVLDECGQECADSLFNHSRVYTLWAPVNSDSWSADELIAQMGGENKPQRDVVFRSFIQAHIANNLVPANGTLDDENNILLLNGKNAIFEGSYKDGGNYYFSGKKLKDRNIRVKNGILHKIESPSEYKYSIWEYMKIAKGEDWSIDLFVDFLYSYNITKFNEGLSIAGPIVNGQQTYIDSVKTTSNEWLNAWKGVGNINNEDSSYIVYVPSDKMWKREVEKAETYFHYDTISASLTKDQKHERDSLRNYYARFHNVKYMTYSKNEQRHVEEEGVLMPVYPNKQQYSNGSWAKKRPAFPIEELDNEDNVVFTQELSNGTFKVVDAMPFTAIDLYHDTISVEVENRNLWAWKENEIPKDAESLRATKKQINPDDPALEGVELSGDKYFSLKKEFNTPATAYFKLPKLLSAKYQVAIIFVPKNITNRYIDEEKDPMTEIRFKVEISQGNDKLFRDSPVHNVNPYGVDTVFLTQNNKRAEIKPTYCELYGDGNNGKDYTVQLNIETVGPTFLELLANRNLKIDTSLRIDKILLIPVPETEE